MSRLIHETLGCLLRDILNQTIGNMTGIRELKV